MGGCGLKHPGGFGSGLALREHCAEVAGPAASGSIEADCGLTSPNDCGCWLPVGLPAVGGFSAGRWEPNLEDAREPYAELTQVGYALPGLREMAARFYFFAQDPDGNNLEFIQELALA